MSEPNNMQKHISSKALLPTKRTRDVFNRRIGSEAECSQVLHADSAAPQASASTGHVHPDVRAALKACVQAYKRKAEWSVSYTDPSLLTCHNKVVLQVGLQYDATSITIEHALGNPGHQRALRVQLCESNILGFPASSVEFSADHIIMSWEAQHCPGPRQQLCSIPITPSAGPGSAEGGLSQIAHSRLPRLLLQLRSWQLAWDKMKWPLTYVDPVVVTVDTILHRREHIEATQMYAATSVAIVSEWKASDGSAWWKTDDLLTSILLNGTVLGCPVRPSKVVRDGRRISMHWNARPTGRGRCDIRATDATTLQIARLEGIARSQHVEALPDDVLEAIMTKLECARDHRSAAVTCRRFRAASLRQLTTLHLRAPGGPHVLEGCTAKLRTLRVGAQWSSLPRLPAELHSLERLDLSYCFRDSFNREESLTIAQLAKMSITLEQLADMDTQQRDALPKGPLCLGGMAGLVYNGPYKWLRQLSSLVSLKQLDLTSCELAVEVLEHCCVSSLQSLHLGGTGVGSLTLYQKALKCKGLKRLAAMKHLHTLTLAQTSIENNKLFLLQNLTALTRLDLSDTLITSIAPSTPLKCMLSLRELKLTSSKVGEPLDGLSHLTSLESLDLAWTTVSTLAHVSDLVSLTKLNLAGTPHTADGLRHISRLTNLKELDLSRRRGAGRWRDDGMPAEFGLVHLTDVRSLTVLKLHHCRLQNNELECLRQLTNLCTLNLQQTEVTNSGIRALTHLRNLKFLNVLHTAVTATAWRVFSMAGVEHYYESDDAGELDDEGEDDVDDFDEY